MPRAVQRSQLVARLAGCLLLACIALTPATAAKQASAHLAPAFRLPARSGYVSLDSLRGHVVYLDFWASWCGPCRASFPWMAGLAERYRARGLKVVAVNLDKERALADAFLVEFPAPFAIAFDPKGGTATSYKVSAMPSSYVIGKDGTLRFRHSGFDAKHTSEVEHEIEEALGQ
jgi:thiol-disulfide isomerase/thioredoxin